MSAEVTTVMQKVSPRLRKLILATGALFTVGFVVSLCELPSHGGNAVSKQPQLSSSEVIQILGYAAWPVLTIAGLISLWLGRPSGRWTYLASWLLVIALTFFSREGIVSGHSMAISILSGLLGGAILGLAFSPGPDRIPV